MSRRARLLLRSRFAVCCRLTPKVVAVTLDLIGLDRDVSLAIRQRIEKQHGLKLDQIALFCSHTHSGPVLTDALQDIYPLEDQQ